MKIMTHVCGLVVCAVAATTLFPQQQNKLELKSPNGKTTWTFFATDEGPFMIATYDGETVFSFDGINDDADSHSTLTMSHPHSEGRLELTAGASSTGVRATGERGEQFHLDGGLEPSLLLKRGEGEGRIYAEAGNTLGMWFQGREPGKRPSAAVIVGDQYASFGTYSGWDGAKGFHAALSSDNRKSGSVQLAEGKRLTHLDVEDVLRIPKPPKPPKPGDLLAAVEAPKP